MNKKIELFAIGGFIAIILIWLCVTFYKAYSPKPQILQGQISAKEYSVSSKLAGRIDEIFVKKGDKVKKGDLIYTIKSPELEAKLTQAQAGYEAAKALSDETHKGTREETIISAKDIWQSAKTMASLAEKTYNRIQSLYDNGVVSLQRRDEAYTAYESAKYNENTAYQQYKIALDGASAEIKKAAFEKERAAKGQVSEVQAYIKDIQTYAPIDGEVSNILLHSGELSPSGFPVALIVDMKQAWLKIAVPEKYLKRFQVGQDFQAYIPALEKKVTFKVDYVSVMGEFATWKATSATKGYDMKSFEIEAKPIQEVEGLRVGMSVLVKLDPSK
ncbi:HlyD family secretion protein [Helicobacter cappadocius]|uniref:Efflux RND transporter periplasmic adaptor subunit n=1 Tax=Helicobacter cappadocius TaxID=3063998 RepID=A0AA90PT63_9HELI|nr:MULTISPECIES: efflux RND transporter periplasmic adaptor subunit [unclassified Helicobacter]MDO7252986.1 efflux RND transporter periplasmic adaptor subunit [Helicobacter sp. faydin-H75]MDP2539024.1 efflux RND transporter periplasmic adaptor subunit [Helicobacter sp. faydin-H76]